MQQTCILCPENNVLNYSTTNCEGYREYKSRPYICVKCPSREKCTQNRKCQKTVTRHIWEDYMELVEDYRHTPKYKELSKRRKETIERVFADAKEKHGMRYTPYRGLAQVTKWVRLKFVALNLKKLVIHLKGGHPTLAFDAVFYPLYSNKLLLLNCFCMILPLCCFAEGLFGQTVMRTMRCAFFFFTTKTIPKILKKR